MADQAVELDVAGQTCRVVTTADPKELQALAKMVEDKLADVVQPGRPVDTRTMLLAAVALANDVREQRARAEAIASKAKTTLQGLLNRVDKALEASETANEKRAARSKRQRKGNQGGEDDADR